MSFEYVSAVIAQSGSESDGSSSTWIIVGIAILLALVFLKPSKTSKNSKTEGGSGITGTGPLTAEAVVAQRFQPTKFQEGYDQDEVDDFLDRTVQEFRRLETERLQLEKADILRQGVPVTAPVITPEKVVSQRFQPTKFREGYAQKEVDDFLDKIAVGLRDRVSENEQLRRRLGPSQYGNSETPN